MATCFIFFQDLDDDSCLCLRLDSLGSIEAPLEKRGQEELQVLQANAKTIVVIPTGITSLHSLELPWIGDRKARIAIPYALEEKVAQTVTSLHFAFDKNHYNNNNYVVVTIDKQLLLDIMQWLDKFKIEYDVITTDWFALNEGESCFNKNSLLVNSATFNGSLGLTLAASYLSSQVNPASTYVFNDSKSKLKDQSYTLIASTYEEWVATRLSQKPVINLCQGTLHHAARRQVNNNWYYASLALFGVMVTLWLSFNVMHYFSLKTSIKSLDKKIAVIYHEFFPNARQVISPKFRVEQWVKGHFVATEQEFWQLLSKLMRVLSLYPSTIQQIHFQNKVLSVTLLSKNFAELEKLESALQKTKIKVTQTSATTHKEKVRATLELS